jgi:chemotaxis protein CheZ
MPAIDAVTQKPPHYDAIEATLMKSRWGRAFLAEYAKRNRTADTSLLLEALARLERIVRKPPHERDDGVWAELIEMSEAIVRLRREITSIVPPHQVMAATVELEEVVSATEQATSDILHAAEQVQEVAWTLREKGVDANDCEMLDRRATDIYVACSFQDITGQRMEKVVKVLRFIEERLKTLLEVVEDTEGSGGSPVPGAGETLGSGPVLGSSAGEGQGLRQADVDRVLVVSDAAADAARDMRQILGLEPLNVASLDETKKGALFG